MGKYILVLLSTILLPVSALGAQITTLQEGRTYQGYLNYGSREESRRYRIVVPEDCFSLEVEMESAITELDLALYDDEGTLVLDSRTRSRTERIQHDRLDRPFTLHPGVYEAEIFVGTSPRGTEAPLFNFSLRYNTHSPGTGQLLVPGQTARATLSPDTGMVSLFEISVPLAQTQFRIDLWGTEADLDLYILPSSVPDTAKALNHNQKMHGNESLMLDTLDLVKQGFLKTGKIYALVVAPWDQSAEDFSIQVSMGREAPLELRRIPAFPPQGTGLTRAWQATVELFTTFGAGSGCVVSPTGHIITNYHVIVDDNDAPVAAIDVGFTLSPEKPSQVLFKARVVDTDPTRDLALLQIDRGAQDQELPQGFRFPWLETLRTGGPNLGDTLHVMGYPGIGSLGSRTTITYTRGVVAGFLLMDFGLVIKSDAELNSGGSGGAALDKDYRLVGLPTQVVGEGSGQMAYINSISLLPEAWLRHLPGPQVR